MVGLDLARVQEGLVHGRRSRLAHPVLQLPGLVELRLHLRLAERQRSLDALEVGPDYEGLPMLRRLLEHSRAVITHSRYVAGHVREAGFVGPIATIPHGAWIPRADRARYRYRLGLEETTPLVGIFGFLKPYKRIAESLRALKRVVRLDPLTGFPRVESVQDK